MTPNDIRHPERSVARSGTRSRRACPELAEGTCLPLAAALLLASLCPNLFAQTPAPSQTSTQTTPTTTFHDPTYHLSFDYPANWTFSRTDGEISTFHLDARSAPRSSRLRAVVAMPQNPFPDSTFSGAYVYLSVAPRSSAASCAQQASNTTIVKNIPLTKPGDRIVLDGLPFTHGHDELRDICITQRDEIYTTYRRGACFRFDLAINNFCGAEVTGVKDISAAQLDQVRARLTAILSTLRFDPK